MNQNFEFLDDLHHNQANDKKLYICKIPIYVLDGKLWADSLLSIKYMNNCNSLNMCGITTMVK